MSSTIVNNIKAMKSKLDKNEFDFQSLDGLNANKENVVAFMRGYKKALEIVRFECEYGVLEIDKLLNEVK